MGRSKLITITELEKKIKNYFRLCDSLNCESEENEKGKIRKPYSLSGLLCELEMTREEFFTLRERQKFAKTIKRSLAKIEAFTEEHALIGDLASSAATNSLKYNFGWGSTPSVEQTENTRSIKILLDEDMMRLAE